MHESLSAWQQAIALIGRRYSLSTPDLAVVLGSGLGPAVESGHIVTRIPYQDIPGFPEPSVLGHAGELLITEQCDWVVWVFSGRFHLYEGYSAAEVVVPVQMAAAAGAARLLLTNAAGAINPAFPVQSFMCITDHLNLTGDNPLRGVRNNPFIDLSRLYNLELYASLTRNNSHVVPLNHGVLAAVPGPSYETPAEVRSLQILGADAVSMSTVPEAIMARYLGMDVAGLSFLSNRAAGCGELPLDHGDVLTAGHAGASLLRILLPVLIREWQAL